MRAAGHEGETNMNKRVLIPAVAALIAALGMSGSALAAESGNSVELHFAGAERISQNGTGGLDIVKADGSVFHYRPQVYQVVNGKRRDLMPGYHVVDKDRVELLMRNVDPSAAVVVGSRR
jgi:hypothetical protein